MKPGKIQSLLRKMRNKDSLDDNQIQRKDLDFPFLFSVFFRVLKALMIVAIIAVLLVGTLGAGIGAGYFAYLVKDTQIPSVEEMEKNLNDYEEVSRLVYSNGETISSIRSDLIRTAVSSEKISQYLKDAIVSTEDEYFSKHNGVVPKALVRAMISDVTGLGGSSGGSTLTQQLVKQQILSDETSYKRKANEVLMALRVEKYFTKDEIITAYLNVSPFGRNHRGENIAGVEEAAKGIFGTTAEKLTLPQAAFIAGLPQSPIVYSPYTNTGELKKDLSYGLKRKDAVLFNMYREKKINEKAYNEAKKYDLTKDFLKQGATKVNQNNFLYNYVYDEAALVIAKQMIEKDGKEFSKIGETSLDRYKELAKREIRRGGYTIQTTIDKGIYQSMQTAVRKYGYTLDEGNGKTVETSSVLTENGTGKILGFIGGRDYQKTQYNHAFVAKRSPGSTIKPILIYAPAIDMGLIGSESMLSNYSTKYTNTNTNVRNYGGQPSSGFVSTRTALKNSYNTSVFYLRKVLYEQGNVIDDYMNKMNMGITKEQFSHESAGVGTAEVTVNTETNAFATLANGGTYLQSYAIESIKDSEGDVIYQHQAAPVQVFSKATASIMNDLMRDVVKSGTGKTAQTTLNGLNPTLGSADWVAKTGTSENNNDFWFIASTPGVTLSSWIGYDDNSAMNATWGSSNMRYWAYLANQIYQNNASIFQVDQRFQLDQSVIKSQVSDLTGEKLGQLEIDGTTRTVPGKEITSYFAKGGAQETQFDFAIGGTEKNFTDFWQSHIVKPAAQTTTDNTTDTGDGDNSDEDATDNAATDENKDDKKTDENQQNQNNTNTDGT